MLTETERKRLRKRQRAERLAEQKERVMLGLEAVKKCFVFIVFFSKLACDCSHHRRVYDCRI